MKDFSDFGLARPIIEALDDEGHKAPTPIQIGAIPPLMQGRDLLGIAQTGTGKTAAFALPILNRLAATRRDPKPGASRALILAPTRELASQVHGRFTAYGRKLGLRVGLIIGGASIATQKAMTRRGVDILVATPGRLIDILQQGALSLVAVETFVLDEVDQMLDLGFLPAIRTIAAKLPAPRQSVFFPRPCRRRSPGWPTACSQTPLVLRFAQRQNSRSKKAFCSSRTPPRRLRSLIS